MLFYSSMFRNQCYSCGHSDYCKTAIYFKYTLKFKNILYFTSTLNPSTYDLEFFFFVFRIGIYDYFAHDFYFFNTFLIFRVLKVNAT